MGLATAPPIRHDLSFRTNADGRARVRWYKSDGTTPVDITTAVLTFQFDLPNAELDEDGVLPPPLDPEVHVVDSTTPADPAGWIDLTEPGVVTVTIPHGIWAGYATSTGVYDLVAVGDLQDCLMRGRFTVEQGVST